MPPLKTRCCLECGSSFQPSRFDVRFCTIPCRKAFDNRAMARGRDLYYLFMALRYERGLAKVKGLWAIACRLGMVWREEDNREREGRKSWYAPDLVLSRLPVEVTAGDYLKINHSIGKKSRA